MNTRASFAGLTTPAVIVYGLLTLLTLLVRALTTGAALATELGERFVQAGEAACAAAKASGARPPQSQPGFHGTTTRAYNAAAGGAR
ncbi:hypothetical protein [Kutzneria sp. CA-103260]|uniref:hypothetical protein n=1 Tax=Kutzneria sp. CA-103260 TaxID=2802641 RepID=UPI001BA8018F|nr:hypothetical protein [Kutzneria sp. CA-103260]QUQ70580.1 hypothetical protein JJ691_83600 [Kutzneria sp. CA-103260]